MLLVETINVIKVFSFFFFGVFLSMFGVQFVVVVAY
jgi:hypothetical protein